MNTDPHTRLRVLRRVAMVGLTLATTACAAVPTAPTGSASRSAPRSLTTPALPATSSAPASQPAAAGLTARLLDSSSAPGGYRVFPPSAYTVTTGSAAAAGCSSAAFSSPDTVLSAVRPVEIAERGIYGPDESGGYFWRGTEQLFGYQGDGAQRALAALRQWVARCLQPQPGGNSLRVSIGSGPKLGDESLTLHVSMTVQTSSSAAFAPFDSIIVRAGSTVFVLSEQGVPVTGGADDNAARLMAVANTAYAKFQRS